MSISADLVEQEKKLKKEMTKVEKKEEEVEREEEVEEEISAETFERILPILNELRKNPSDPIEATDFVIHKFRGGYVSEIYRVEFTDSANSKLEDFADNKQPQHNRLPKKLVVKFFNTTASKAETGFDVVTAQLNALAAGEAGLGPRIYLIRPDAIVMQYFDAESLTAEHDTDLRLREDVARKLAQFHALDVPIPRNTYHDMITQLFNVWLTQELLDRLTESGGPLLAALRANSLTNLEQNNFRAEADFVHQLVLDHPISSTQIVFSHYDLTHLNFLVTNQSDADANDGSERITAQTQTVLFIDFDLSAYFHRAVDLGRYFVDCARPGMFHGYDLIDDNEFLQFIEWYRDENQRIHGTTYTDDADNSAQQLLNESKLFALYAYMVDCIFCIFVARQAADGDDSAKMTQFLRYADERFGGYLRTKARFLRDGSIP